MTLRKFSLSTWHYGVLAAAITLLGAHAPEVRADAIDILATPPDTNASVTPNVVVTFDDSGSMASTSLPDKLYDNRGAKYYYSASTNRIYFDPAKDYPPPLKPDGTSFPDSVYTKAPRDGFCANWPTTASPSCTPLKVDLSSKFYAGFVTPDNSPSPPSANQTGTDIGSSIRASDGGGFWYECSKANDDASCTLKTVGVDAVLRQKFANWYSYYRTRNLMTRTAMSRVFAKVGDTIRVAWQNINANPLDKNSTIDKFAGAQRKSFFDWLYATPTADSTPNRKAVIRAGKFYSNDTGAGFVAAGTKGNKNPYWETIPTPTDSTAGRELSCRQNYNMLVTDGYWNESGVDTLPGDNVDESFTLPIPDGEKTGVAYAKDGNFTKVYWNRESGGTTPSLSDIAFFYWANDLRTDLANRVPTSLSDTSTGKVTGTKSGEPDPEIYFNPANDPASWQHVVQFMVGLGVAGTLTADDATLLSLRKGTKWPAPISGGAQAIDDTWHAAVNSRGKYFSANNPQNLVDALAAILNNIVQRRGSATAVSVNTGVLNSGALAYSGGYDSGDWSGYLTGVAIDASSGDLGAAKWDAGCLLTGGTCKAMGGSDVGAARAPSDRVIVTSSDIGKGKGVAFQWGSLGSTAQSLLNADGNGDKRVDYLRGDRTYEDSSGTPAFRQRTSVLGPVVNSQPVFVSYPDSGYRDDFPAGSDEATAAEKGKTYEQFAYDHKDRAGTLYVGANDGMLHAFDAKTGKERWAYVPNTVLGKLNDYSKVGGGLVPSVDNTPVVRDVFFGGEWHTLLVGTLRLGGRGVFALDVTNPDKITETDAGKLVLWESNATLAKLANLGYTFGAPNIGRLPSGKWAVFVSGGYFPKDSPEATSDAAKRQQSSLFVLDAETGEVIKEVVSTSGIVSYGLAAPVLADYSDDQIDDAAFAGDIRGNLWRFDLRSWTVDQVFAPTTPGDRPITVMPRLFPDPVTQRLIVVFGTGKYLGAEDRLSSTAKIQAFYGVREAGPSDDKNYPASYYPVKDTDLVAQTLKADGKLLKLTDSAVDAKSKKGWTFDLLKGERNVTTAGALFNSNRAILVTLKPNGDDPCDPSRKGSILVVDAANGGPADGPPVLSGGDKSVPGVVVGTEVSNPPVGGSLSQVNRQGGGEIVLPGVVLSEDNKTTFGVLDAFWRRRSWRELLNH